MRSSAFGRGANEWVGRIPVVRAEAWTMSAIIFLGLVADVLLIERSFPGPDATSYDKFAHDGQEWSYWTRPEAFEGNFFPMGYPTILAMAMRIAGGSTWLYQLLSITMALCVVVFAWSLTRHISRIVRLTTMAVVAASPSLLWMGQNNGYEMLICFLMMLSLVIVWRPGGEVNNAAQGRLGLLGSIIAGLCMGLAMLTQAKTLIVLPFLIYFLWRRGWAPTVTFLSTALVPLIVWSFRNVVVLSQWSPFSRNGEMGIWLGNNPYTTTGGVVASAPEKPAGFSSFYEASLNFVISQPESAYTLFTRRIARLLEPTYTYRDISSLPVIDLLPHYYAIAFSLISIVLFATFVFGRIWASSPPLPPVAPIAVFVLLFFLVHLPFQSEPRYLTPITPIALAVCVPTAFALWPRIRRRGLVATG